jgi:hypothetical protein
MTAFVPANIPSRITTIEALNVWTSEILRTYNPVESIRETELIKTPIASNVQVPMADGQVRNISRLNIPLNPLYGSNGRKIWENTTELSVVTLGTTFTTNSTAA